MSVTAIVGANWGDEGKGKITDFLAAKADMVIRFQGGNNAGHTIINDYGKFALHLLPSGVCYPNVTNVLGPGVALNIKAFLNEKNDLINAGVPEPKLVISDRAQVVMPYHILFDQYEEERLADKKFGSTKSGIAPFYSDKYLKLGIQVSDLFDKAYLKQRIEQAIVLKNALLKDVYCKELLDVTRLTDELFSLGQEIKPYVVNTLELVNNALKANKQIVVEGQLGALRDPDYGIYPFSTSSSTLAGFASVGAGVPPSSITKVIAVAKAYSTCVGAGPFVTEIFGEVANELRERGGDGGEYGATTGRARRMGWFDVVATRHGCLAQGATEVVLSLLDVLGYLDEIPVCTAYEIKGEKTKEFPVSSKIDKAKPVLKNLKGWKKDISEIREFGDLPKEAKDYVLFIEKEIGFPIKWISVGPKREAMIKR